MNVLKRIPTRIVLGLLCATGIMVIYMSRTILSIAIVEMVQIVDFESSTLDESPRQPYCLISQNETLLQQNSTYTNSSFENEATRSPPIKITTMQRAAILSAFFYTYGICSILGGPVAERWGTKRVFIAAILVDSVGNFFIPLASKYNYIYIIIIRILMGFSQSFCFPSLHSLLSKWIPTIELSRFMSSVYFANNLGTIFSLNIGGIIVNNHGYELAFYVCGLLGPIWLIFWVALMHETPEIHPRITEKEKNYILETRASSSIKQNRKTPWMKIFTSIPVWANIIASAGNMFGLSFLITQLPLYMSSVIGLNIKTNGLLSSLPFLSRFLGSNFFSWLTSLFMRKTNWTKKTWQRICTFGGHWCCAWSYLMVGYVGCDETAALCLFCLGALLNGFSVSGFLCNPLQIAPNFAGTIMGIGNTFSFLYSTVCLIIIGALTSEETLGEWRTVYWFIFGNYFICGLIYMIFLSADIQPWNDDAEKTSENQEDESEELNLMSQGKA